MGWQKLTMTSLIYTMFTASFFSVVHCTDMPNDGDQELYADLTKSTFSTSEEMKELKMTTVKENNMENVDNESYPFMIFSTELYVEDAEKSINFTNANLTTNTSLPESTLPDDINTFSTIGTQGRTYMDDMTITYQTTTETLKDKSPIEDSTLLNSSRNLYYDARMTTENDSSNETSYFPDTTSFNMFANATPSLTTLPENSGEIISEHTSLPTAILNASTPNHFRGDEIMSDVLVTEEHNLHETKSETVSIATVEENTSVKYTETEPQVREEFYSSVLRKDSITKNKQKELYINENENMTVTEDTMTTESTLVSRSLVSSTETASDGLIKDIFTEESARELIGKRKEIFDSSKDLDEVEKSSDGKVIENDTTEESNTFSGGSDIDDDTAPEATEVSSNSTRNPKRIQGSQERYPEGRVRPIRPDPGYGSRPEMVRPYRPDTPLHQYPYYRPTPDYRTPLIRQDTDYTRPARPDPDYQRISFRPNYGYSKPTQDTTDSPRPSSSTDSSASKPYRPSFSRPYHPQSSFGRPYRPDFQRPSSRPSEEASVTPKPSIDFSAVSNQEPDIAEHSRADYDYTKQSEAVPEYPKSFQSDVRPSQLKPDISKPYRPTYDALPETSVYSKTSSAAGTATETRDSTKVSKPDIQTSRPASFYPRPGFGNNYLTDTSVRPFSVGTVTSAKNLTRVEFIKADCFDNHMKVTMRFNGTFNGLVYSSGYAQDSSCSYVNGSGRNHYEFFIRLNRCGTLGQQEVAERLGPAARRRQERAQYLVNTVTVQYNPVIEEDIDEHFRVTCEYGYDFWKTVTFPVVSVESSAVKVRTGSPVVFTLPPPQCNMEIRSGFGPSGNRVSGPVNVGDPLTLVIHMKSESTGFDILVSNCFAHNGAQKRLQLIDSNGCVVQEKLVSPFRGVSSPDRTQQVTLYSYLKAFRFTGSPALYIECDVHMCHGSCPPQRCYWRHLYKRSAPEVTESTTQSGSVMSESVSLFQSLEVRHEEADAPHPLALRNLNGRDDDDMVCLRTGGFAAIFAVLLLLLFLTSFVSVCMCLRMRKMKSFVDAPDTKYFVEFDGHVPKK